MPAIFSSIRYAHIREEDGFTLVELAIVLVIVGLLVGLGSGLIGPLTRRAKNSETKETINAAVEAIIGFTVTNNALPTIAQFPSLVRSQNDSWNKPLVYVFSNNLTSSLCGRRGTDLTVRVCNDATGTSYTAVNNVAFIVLSSGENFNNQTAASLAVVAPGTFINTYLPGISVDNYTGAGDFSRPTDDYDDVVKWVTLDELKIKAGCAGSQLRVINNEIPYVTVGNPYSAEIYADGGIGGQLRWCVETTSPPPGITFTPNTISPG